MRGLTGLVREWLSRSLWPISRRRRDNDLLDELAHHLEMAEQDFIARGHSPSEAARLARVRHGQSDNALEQLRRQRTIPWFGAFTLDVRLGFRMLRKFPGLTAIGGLALTLGFAILTTVFTYFDVIMWNNALPLDDGDEVVAIQLWDTEQSRRRETAIVDYQRWRDEMRTLTDVGAFRTVQRDVTFPDGSVERFGVAELSASGFRMTRVEPALGRTLSPADERGATEPVVVIGYDEWTRRFAQSEDVIGQTIRIGEFVHTIVGVMPERFGFPINHQYWVPLIAGATELLPPPPAGAVFGRLNEGATRQSAQLEVSTLGLAGDSTLAESVAAIRPTIVTYANNFVSDTDPRNVARRNWNARLVMIFVCLLLIPPCANIAMLVYARSVTRQEEIAIRTALGASRTRIVTQLFIEMLVLTTLAAIVALAFVSMLSLTFEKNMLRQLERLPFWIDFDLSVNSILFAATLAILCAIATGLLPALQSTRNFSRPGLSALDPRNRLRLGALWTTLAVAQIAFSFAALPTAVELAWGTLRPHAFGPGFSADSYLTARLYIDDGSGNALTTPDVAARLAEARSVLIAALERDRAVESRVTETSLLPGQGGPGAWHRVVVDSPIRGEPDAIEIGNVRVGAPLGRRVHIDDRYFETMQSSLLSGRLLENSEYRGDARSIVVNEAFSNLFFADENPLGRRIRYASSPQQLRSAGMPADENWYEIVGVTADRPAWAEGPTAFHSGQPAAKAPHYLMFRTGPDAAELRTRLGKIAGDIDPLLRVDQVRTLAELYEEQAFGNYIGGFALIVGSLAVLMLSAAGLYALMSFTVNQRQREIGIRLALGARPQRLLAGVFRTALRQAGCGALLGLLVAALIDNRIPATALGGLDVPGVLPAAALLMTVIGMIAAWGPVRRTLAVSPSNTLKQD